MSENHHEHSSGAGLAGLRLTSLRRRVLDVVCAARQPVGAYDILAQLRAKDASATAAGVYRSLEFLTGKGLVHRLESTKAFVACVMPEHRHMAQFVVCRQCGRAAEADDHALSAAAAVLVRHLGYDEAGATLEISALCQSCREQVSPPVE